MARIAARIQSPEAGALFQALGALPIGGEGRLSAHEDLVDVLEVVAVAVGVRPAHLQGQGCHDRHRVDILEEVSEHFGLKTLRTGGVVGAAFTGLPPKIAAYFAAMDREQAKNGPDRLWVFRDDSLKASIFALMGGRYDLFTSVLGYPACCVEASEARQASLARLAVSALGRALGSKDDDVIIAALKSGSDTDLLPEDSEALRRFAMDLPPITRFPFIGFYPCPACVAREDSPAGRINEAMKALATRLSPPFAQAIVDAAVREAQMGEASSS